MKKTLKVFVLSGFLSLVLTGCFSSYVDSSSSPINEGNSASLPQSESIVSSSSEKEIDLSMFQSLNQNGSSFTGETDASGNIWIAFSPKEDGLFSISNYTYGTMIAVYDLTKLGYDISHLVKPEKNAIFYGLRDENQFLVDLRIYAGHHYVIKYGMGYSKDIKFGTDKGYSGQWISFYYSFISYLIKSYDGPQGELLTFTKDGNLDHIFYKDKRINNVTQLKNYIYYDEPSKFIINEPDEPMIERYEICITLNNNNSTYNSRVDTRIKPVFNVLTESSTGVNDLLGPDNNIWATFSPVNDCLVWIDELPYTDSPVDLLSVYEKKEVGAALSDYSNWGNDYLGSSKAINHSEPYILTSEFNYSGNGVCLHEFFLEGGKTYIIKLGDSTGNSLYPGQYYKGVGDGYDYMPASFSFRCEQLDSVDFNGEDGVITLESYNGKFENAKVDGIRVDFSKADYDEDLNLLSVYGDPTYQSINDSIDPTFTRSEKDYILNPINGTYETVDHGFVTRPIINEIYANTLFKGVTGEDGAFYAKFIAPMDGYISFACTKYLNVYEEWICVFDASKPGTNATNFRHYVPDRSNGTYMDKVVFRKEGTSNKTFEVSSGNTYVIKVCNYAQSTGVIGEKVYDKYFINLKGEIELNFTH